MQQTTIETTQGDRQRLPSADQDEYIVLRDPITEEPLDLTLRDVDFILTTHYNGGNRIELTNDPEIGNPEAGEVGITLSETDTSIPISHSERVLYGQFRVTGGENDPTTVPPGGYLTIIVHNSAHATPTEDGFLSVISSYADLATNGVVDAAGTRLGNLSDPTNPSDATTRSWVSNQIAAVESEVTSVFGRTGDVTAQSGDYSVDQVSGSASTEDVASVDAGLQTHMADTGTPHGIDKEYRVSNGVVNAGFFDTYEDARQFCVDHGYGVIYVPSGEYNERCNVPDGVQVYGDGFGTWFNAPGKGATIGQESILRRIRLSTGTGQLDDAIDPVGSGSVIQSVTISHAQRNGILVRGANDTYITGVRFAGQVGNVGVNYFSSSSGNILNHCWISGGIQNSGDNVIGSEIYHI